MIKKKSNKQELNLPERNVPAEVETLFEDICFANVCGKIPFYFYNLTETDKKKKKKGNRNVSIFIEL